MNNRGKGGREGEWERWKEGKEGGREGGKEKDRQCFRKQLCPSNFKLFKRKGMDLSLLDRGLLNYTYAPLVSAQVTADVLSPSTLSSSIIVQTPCLLCLHAKAVFTYDGASFKIHA